MKASRLRRVAALAVGGALALPLAGLMVVGWQASERAIHPAPRRPRQTLADYPDLRAQSITFESRTHTRIAGTFFPGRLRTTLVLSHGYGDNQEQLLPYVDFLVRRGFSVFTYDMRSRGRSGGDAVTLGALEALDLQSALDYLCSRPDVDRDRIGAFGLSLGGVVSILSAAVDSRIKALVDDSAFSDANAAIAASFEHFIGLPAFPFAPITVFLSRVRTGTDVTKVRPIDVVGRLSPRPLLIIHCQDDQVIPVDNSERIFAAAREPKQFWRIPGGRHVGGHSIARAEYENRVSSFFESALR